MNFSADDQFNRGRAKHPVFGDVPACLLEESVASRNQGGKVRHRGAGDQPSFAIERQSKSLANPPENHIFEFRGDRRHHAQRRVLIPCCCDPAGRERSRNHSAVYEAKVASAGRRGGCRRTNSIQLIEHLGGVTWFRWKRLVKLAESGEIR